MVDHRPILEAIVRGMSTHDFSIYDRHFTEDFVDEFPQSGEVTRGPANARWIIENYPQPADVGPQLDPTVMRLQSSDEVKVVAPTFSIVKLEGRGNEGTAVLRSGYPDGSIWWVIVLYQLRGDRICRSSTFFAPEFPAPEWRAAHVERAPGR
jgi:hypothetical protein